MGLSYLGSRFGSTLGDKLDVLGQRATLPAYTTLDLHLNYQNKCWNRPFELKLSIKMPPTNSITPRLWPVSAQYRRWAQHLRHT